MSGDIRDGADAQPAGGASPLSPQAVSAKGAHRAYGFTPGPWCVGNGGDPHGAEWEVRSADDADWYITGVPWGDDKFDTGIPRFGNAEANARLIAAAPEMLAACQAVAASSMRNEAYDLCVAAIRQAAGEA